MCSKRVDVVCDWCPHFETNMTIDYIETVVQFVNCSNYFCCRFPEVCIFLNYMCAVQVVTLLRRTGDGIET